MKPLFFSLSYVLSISLGYRCISPYSSELRTHLYSPWIISCSLFSGKRLFLSFLVIFTLYLRLLYLVLYICLFPTILSYWRQGLGLNYLCISQCHDFLIFSVQKNHLENLLKFGFLTSSFPFWFIGFGMGQGTCILTSSLGEFRQVG